MPLGGYRGADHVWSVPGERTTRHRTSFAPNVPPENRDYTNLYKLITAGIVSISTTVSRSQGIAGRGSDASLDTH